MEILKTELMFSRHFFFSHFLFPAVFYICAWQHMYRNKYTHEEAYPEIRTNTYASTFIYTYAHFPYEHETIMFYFRINANNKMRIHCKCSSSNIIDLHLDAVAIYRYT